MGLKCSKCGRDYSDNFYKDETGEEILCEDCLLNLDKVTTSTITNYFIDGEYIGDDSESIQPVIDEICEYFDYKVVE